MLGSRITYLRKRARLSQAELAMRLGVSPSTVGSYEQGRREPSANILIALSREFGVSIDYLLTGSISIIQNYLALDDSFSQEELAVLFAAYLIG